jgi:hypothetical protein
VDVLETRESRDGGGESLGKGLGGVLDFSSAKKNWSVEASDGSIRVALTRRLEYG